MNRAWNTAIKETRVYMSSARLGNLSELVRSQYQKAIEAGDAFFYDSQVRVTKSGASQDGERQKTVPWQIRTVPAVCTKLARQRTRQLHSTFEQVLRATWSFFARNTRFCEAREAAIARNAVSRV